jgi:hypothetical protein
MVGRLTLIALAATMLTPVATIVAQTGITPQNPPLTAPTAAPPDTAGLLVTAPAEWPLPTALSVHPDSLLFGELVLLTVDFPVAVAGFSPDSLRYSADWVEPAPAVNLPADDSRGPVRSGGRGGDAAPAGLRRFDLPLRIYRAGPLTVTWISRQDATAMVQSLTERPRSPQVPSALVHVSGRTIGTDQIAAIRDPRSLGWNLAALAFAAAAVIALAALFGWLWRRRRGPYPGPADWALSAPPELEAAVALWRLEDERPASRSDGRAYLDQLAQVIRRYLHRRFHLLVGELTPAEVVPAGLRLGYRSGDLTGFAELLRTADEWRYRPGAVAPGVCRAQTAQAIALIRRYRCRELITPVDGALRATAERAWERLDASYPSPALAALTTEPLAGPSGGEQ